MPATEHPDNRLPWTAPVVLLVLLSLAARASFPDADPKFEYWIGYVTDEGRWVETARNLALFGEMRLYGISKLHLVLSPGHQAMAFAAFELLGVNLLSARLWTVLCAVALVLAVARCMVRLAPGWPAALAVTLVGLEPLGLSLSRTSLPEVPALLFSVLAFLALLPGSRPRLSAGAAGLLFAVAMSMKATTVLVLPAFLAMIALAGTGERARERAIRLAAFAAGLGVPCLAGLAVAARLGLVRLDGMGDVMHTLTGALVFGGPYPLLSRVFDRTGAYGSLQALLFLAWFASWVAPFWRSFRGTPLGEAYLASGVWSVAWLLLVGTLEYTPSRYSVHVLVPIALHAATGLALWSRVDPLRFLDGLPSRPGLTRLAAGFWLFLPLSFLGVASIAAMPGFPAAALERLGIWILALSAPALAAAVPFAAGAHRVSGKAVIVATGAAGAAYFLVDAVVALGSSGGAMPADLALARLVVGCAAAIAGGWLATREPGSALRPGLLLAGGLATILALGLRNVPAIAHPTHSLREGARDIDRRYANARLVRSHAASSLLMGTRLFYRDAETPSVVPDAIVSASPSFTAPPGFELEGTRHIDIHPRFAVGARLNREGGRVKIDLYRNSRPANEISASPPDHHGTAHARESR